MYYGWENFKNHNYEMVPWKMTTTSIVSAVIVFALLKRFGGKR